MDIEWSKNYLLNRTKWKMDVRTFQILDEAKLMWVARMTTTHLHEGGEPEETFTVLVRANEHFVLEDSQLSALVVWAQRPNPQHDIATNDA